MNCAGLGRSSISKRTVCRFIPDYLVLTSLEQTRQRRRLKGVICQNSRVFVHLTQRPPAAAGSIRKEAAVNNLNRPERLRKRI